MIDRAWGKWPVHLIWSLAGMMRSWTLGRTPGCIDNFEARVIFHRWLLGGMHPWRWMVTRWHRWSWHLTLHRALEHWLWPAHWRWSAHRRTVSHGRMLLVKLRRKLLLSMHRRVELSRRDIRSGPRTIVFHASVDGSHIFREGSVEID